MNSGKCSNPKEFEKKEKKEKKKWRVDYPKKKKINWTRTQLY
jgi:hypothetical protein